MRYRKKLSKKRSRKKFRKYAGSHKRNYATVKRGGIRL